jgi:hypothetical protein
VAVEQDICCGTFPQGLLSGLSNQFFAVLPECLGVVWIKRMPVYTFADGANGYVGRNYIADMAVLAISAADLLFRGNSSGPYRSADPCRVVLN